MHEIGPDAIAIKVMVLDESESIRRDLSLLLSSEPEISVPLAAGRIDQALDRLAEVVPDVVIADPKMRGRDGLHPFDEIRRTDASVSILSFGVFASDSSSTGSMRADGALQKDCEPAELVAMVRALAQIAKARRGS